EVDSVGTPRALNKGVPFECARWPRKGLSMATAVAKHLHPVEMLERMTAREVLDLEDPEGILRSLESVMDDHYQPAKLRDKAREWVAGLRILVGTRAEFLEGVRHVTDRDLRDDDMLTWFTQGDMKDLENAALSAP